MRHSFIILILFLLFCSAALGQPYYFRHYQVENGLSNNAVICSLQDKNGFMWFGTKDGLNRFDGYTFKAFRNEAEDSGSIGNNFIHCLYIDKNNTLWVGTENGLYRYNETLESFSLLPATHNGLIRDISMDKEGKLWFISNFTLFKYDPLSKKASALNTNLNFEATSITNAPNGDIYVSTTMGFLYKYNFSNNTFYAFNIFPHSSPADIRWIEKIHATKKGDILIGTSNAGALLFSTQNKSIKNILTYTSDNTAVFVRNFIETGNDDVWIASESGIYIINLSNGKLKNLQKKYNDPYSISDNAVYTFCKDNEGGIWAGTYFGGINYYPKLYNTFEKHFPKTGENSLSGNVVREIKQDGEGNLWIGTEDAGLNKFIAKTGQFVQYKPTGKKGSISYTNIHGLLVEGNHLWIGTFEHGLDILDIASGKVIKHYTASPDNGLKSNFIYSITTSEKGEILVCTPRGVYEYNKETDYFKQVEGLPSNIWYTSVLKDAEGNIWAGTYGFGAIYFNQKTKASKIFRRDANDKNSLRNDRINTIYKDTNGSIWMATEGGLSKLNNKGDGFIHYTTKNGFPSNFILSLLEDDHSNLWVSTSKGLVSFNTKTERLNVYSRANGILNDQFNFNSAFKSKEGKMYFGSVKGFISFHPAEVIKNNFVPPVYITNFQVFNEELSPAHTGSPLKKSILNTSKIVLPYHQSTISIGFAALSFTAPEMSEYVYKMEGLENNWTYLKKNRKAYFTQLPPGNYTFKVKASNNSGIWNKKETTLYIQILPPWWQSNGAYALYFVLFICLILYMIHTVRKRIEIKNRRRMELFEVRKEKEIYEAKIEFFTNVAHEIRTPLTLIKGPLEKVMKKVSHITEIQNSLKMIDRNTVRLVNLTNQLLDFRQTEIKGYSLNYIRVNISELIEDTYNNFISLADAKNIDISICLPAETLFAYVDVEAFSKILYNLFSNAVKYADSKVAIQLMADDTDKNLFTVIFKNDGYLIPLEMNERIFEPFFRLKESEIEKGTGIGLALSRSLAELHKGTLQLNTPQENMNVFCLQMPMHQENEFQMQYKGVKKVAVNNENKL